MENEHALKDQLMTHILTNVYIQHVSEGNSPVSAVVYEECLSVGWITATGQQLLFKTHLHHPHTTHKHTITRPTNKQTIVVHWVSSCLDEPPGFPKTSRQKHAKTKRKDLCGLWLKPWKLNCWYKCDCINNVPPSLPTICVLPFFWLL